MAISSANPGYSGIRKVVTLTSGTSWTVPNGVTYVNALLVGGGGGGGAAQGSANYGYSHDGMPGNSIETTVTTTPGASITYAIGAGGTAGVGASGSAGGTGGTTTFTGATSASGGGGGGGNDGGTFSGAAGSISFVNNGGGSAIGGGGSGGTGGSGFIRLEYWVQEITMKKFAVIENNKVINIVVGVEEEVVMAHPDMFIEYTDGNWDYNNGIDGGDFFPVPVTE